MGGNPITIYPADSENSTSGAIAITGNGKVQFNANDVHIKGDGSELQLGAYYQDYSIQFDGTNAIHTLASGDFIFTGGDVHVEDNLFADNLYVDDLIVEDTLQAGRVEAGIGTFYTNVISDKFIITDGRESLYYDVSFGWASEQTNPKTDDNPVIQTGLFLKEQYVVGMTAVETEVQTWTYDHSAFALPLGIVDGASGAPGLYFNDDPTIGIYRDTGGGNRLVISNNSTDIIKVFDSFVHIPATLYMDQGFGDVDFPCISWWNDSTTGIYQAIDESGRLDFTSFGVHVASIGSDGITVDDDIYDATDWDGNFTVPTKNAVRDKIETITSNVSTTLDHGNITATTYGITSDGGVDDIVLPEADTDDAGLLGADKWDEIVASTTHLTSTGADHSYIDQAVTAASSPTFVDVFATDVHASNSVDAQTGFFYAGLHIGDSTSESEANMWKIYSRTDGTHNLVIANEQGANDADPRVGNQVEIDAGIMFWPNIPSLGPVLDFAPMIEFTPTYNDMAIWSKQPFLHHAPTVTYDGNIAPTQAGMLFAGTYSTTGNLTFQESMGIKFERTTTVTDVNQNMLIGDIFEVAETRVWDNVDFDTSLPSAAFKDQTVFACENGSVSILEGDYESFNSGPFVGSDGSGDMTINKFVAFRGRSFTGLSGANQWTVLLHRYFQLENDTFSDAVEGVWSDIPLVNGAGGSGMFLNHIGDAASFIGGEVEIDGALIGTPDEITATSAGVAASIVTINTEVTTNGDSDLDNVTLANGKSGQVKHIYCVVEGNAADTWKITPATMCGGTQITFAGVGEGCTLIYADSEGWVVTANNGGTIA
jgi:hypothetical protein